MTEFRIVPLLDSSMRSIIGWRIEENLGDDGWIPLDEFYTRSYKHPDDAKIAAVRWARELKRVKAEAEGLVARNTIYV